MDWLSSVSGLFGFVFPFLERLPVVRAILGVILVFFLPGFAWTLVFFRQLGVIERVTLSVGLSIALVTLSLLVTSKLMGVRITAPNSALVIVGITVVPVLVYYLGRVVRRKKGGAT